MAWVAFIERKEGVEYKCETCLDYGGLMDDETSDHEGLPFTMFCPDCCTKDE